MAYVGPKFDPLHRHGLTLSKILDPYVETPATGQREPILWQSRPNLCFTCTHVLNKPKQIEKSIGEPSYGESYRGRPAWAPGLGFRRTNTAGASESLENLHVSLSRVWKCDGRLVDAISRSRV